MHVTALDFIYLRVLNTSAHEVDRDEDEGSCIVCSRVVAFVPAANTCIVLEWGGGCR